MASRVQSRIHILEAYLLKNVHLLNFFQALHMLHRLAELFQADGRESIHIKPILNFHQTHSKTIKAIHKLDKPGHYEIETNYLSLYAEPGNMGYAFTEYLLTELDNDHYHLADFLLISQRALYETYYQTTYQNQILYPTVEQNNPKIKATIFNLLGYKTEENENYLKNLYRKIALKYFNLFAHRYRSAKVLQHLLNAYYQDKNIQIRIREDVGYIQVPKDALRISLGDNTKTLGENSILGQYEYSFLASIEIQMKFHHYQEFLIMMNTEKDLKTFLYMISSYMERNMYIRVKAIVPGTRKASHLTRLGYKSTAVLGKNAWIYTHSLTDKNNQKNKTLVARFAVQL